MPALLSWVNWLDRSSAVITANGQSGSLGPTRLAEPQLRARWRSAAGVVAPQLDVDFGAVREVGIIALAQPDDAGGINADGEPLGWMASTDRVWSRLDDGAAGLTNLLSSPEAFTPAAWVRTATNVTVGAIAAPNASQAADMLTFVNLSSFARQSITVAADTTPYRLDTWLKAGTATTTILRLRTGLTSRLSGIQVDLVTGAVSTAPSSSYTPDNVTVTNYGDGWWRCGFSMPNNSLTDLRADITNSAAAGSTIYAWGAQIVPGTAPVGYRGSTATAGINSPGVGALYDSANAAGGWRTGYGFHVQRFASPLSARYWRCTLNAASLASVPGFVDLGRAWAGPTWQPSRGNIAYGFGETWGDGAEVQRNPRSGLEFVDLGPRQRVLSFGFPVLTEADAAQIRELQRIAGTNRQVLFVPFPEAGAEKAAPIIGRLTEVQPITLPSFARYAATFQIRQSI